MQSPVRCGGGAVGGGGGTKRVCLLEEYLARAAPSLEPQGAAVNKTEPRLSPDWESRHQNTKVIRLENNTRIIRE